jgi:hypothetical protein
VSLRSITWRIWLLPIALLLAADSAFSYGYYEFLRVLFARAASYSQSRLGV